MQVLAHLLLLSPVKNNITIVFFRVLSLVLKPTISASKTYSLSIDLNHTIIHQHKTKTKWENIIDYRPDSSLLLHFC